MSQTASIFGLFQVPQALQDRLPVDKLVEHFNAIPRGRPYSAIAGFEAELQRQLQDQSEITQECVARVVMAEAIRNNYWQPTCAVPEPIRAEVDGQLKRVCEALDSKPAGYYRPGGDNFRKDSGLIRGSLLPLGAGVIDTDSSIWRRPLKVSTLRQRINFIRFYFRAPRGLKPLFQIHTHTEMLDKFSESGWSNAYQLIGELVRLNPRYKGFFRASWFCDPEVSSISPRLSYIVREPTSAGAFVCYLGPDHSGSALSKSGTRQKLHAEGKYIPKSYMLIWHRDDLLSWCEKTA